MDFTIYYWSNGIEKYLVLIHQMIFLFISLALCCRDLCYQLYKSCVLQFDFFAIACLQIAEEVCHVLHSTRSNGFHPLDFNCRRLLSQIIINHNMSDTKKLSSICPYKLHESYDALFELQRRLKITDDYLLSVAKDPEEDEKNLNNLEVLLDAWNTTRDNLITWYLKQTLVELNVTISLLTAKIKFIEHKLGQCDGLDVHQACSLSLVNFCNILADMTIVNTKPLNRKTMHQVSNEIDVPIWLSHYRNQICHVPSEGPCIAILVPLVVKSLEYMRDSFWVRVLEKDTFKGVRCEKLIQTIANNIDVISVNQNLTFKEDLGSLSKKRLKVAKADLVESSKAIKALRRMCKQDPNQVCDMISGYLVLHNPNVDTKNCGLLLEQVILARSLERVILKIIKISQERYLDKKPLLWLLRLIELISCTNKDDLKLALKRLNLNISVKMIRLINISPLKCCHIANQLIKIDNPIVKKFITRMRFKLKPILGADRTRLFIQLTRMAKSTTTYEEDHDISN